MPRHVTLRARIVLLFGMATLAVVAAVAGPLWVLQELTDGALGAQRKAVLELAWSNALNEYATRFEIVAAQLAVDPALVAAQDDPVELSRLLRDVRNRTGAGDAAVQRLDAIAADGRLIASSADGDAGAPLVAVGGLASRLARDPWLISVEEASDGPPNLVVTAALPGARFLALSAALEPALRAFDRAGAETAERGVFLVGRRGDLLLATDPPLWPVLAPTLSGGGGPVLLHRNDHVLESVSTPLLNGVGVRVATLAIVQDATAAAQRRSLVLLLTGCAAAVLFAALLLGLYGFARNALEPLAQVARVIQSMAAGDAMAVADIPARRDEVGALARAVEVFRHDILALARNRIAETLRRARQQALIRQEMQSLAAVLDAGERESLLAELRTIEVAGTTDDGAALASAFSQMAARVTAQHVRLADLLAERTRDLDVVRRALAERTQLTRLREELDIARRLQMGSLPAVFPPFPGRTEFDLFAAMTPAREVGGDFYDLALLGDRLLLTVGDASGKGVSGAMFVAVTRTLLRSAVVGGASPAQALALANRAMSVDNPTMMFTTAAVVILDLVTGRLTYANAGHDPPYLLLPDGTGTDVVRPLAASHGIALGVLDDAEYDDAMVTLAPDTGLVMFTDGVTEANRRDGALFGQERLAATLRHLAAEGPERLVAGIQDAVGRFAEGEEQADDITVLAARFRHVVFP